MTSVVGEYDTNNDGGINNSGLDNDSVTVTSGDGLKNGGSVALGGSITIDIEPSDFAGNALVDDGVDNLAVASNGIQTDELDTGIAPTWTGKHQFNAGIDTRGDIEDDTTTIWDTSAGEIPDSAMGSIDNSTLTNSSVTVAGNSVSLGGSTSVSIDDLGDVASSSESAGQLPIWNNTAGEYQNSGLTGGTEIAVTQGDASVTIDLDTPINFGADTDTDVSGNDLTDGATVIWDTSVGEIPDSAMGSIDNATLTNSSVTVAGNSVSLGGSTSVSVNDLSDVASSTESAGQLPIWNGTASEYQNSSLTGGNALSVTNADASITIDVDTDGIQTDELDQTANYSFTNLGQTKIASDSTKLFFGAGDDASATFDGTNFLVDYDAQNSGTSSLKIQQNGIDVFSIGTSGNVDVNGNDIGDGGTTIWDTSAGEIPDSAMGSIDNSTLTNSSVTVAGNTVSLGGSTAVSVNDLSDVSSSSESAGQLPIWNGTAGEYQNSGLTGGNAIGVTNADASVTIDVDTDGIQTDELDQTANYSFTNLGQTDIASDSTKLRFGAGQDATIEFDGTDALLDYDAQNSGTSSLKIQQNGTDRFLVDTNGDSIIPAGNGLLVGDTSKIDVFGATYENQLIGDGKDDSGWVNVRFGNNGFGGQSVYGKSRGSLGTIGTAVQSGDQLSLDRYIGDDGSNTLDSGNEAVRTEVEVDGAVSTSTVPGRYIVKTQTTGGTLTEALRIDSSQDIIAKNGNVSIESDSKSLTLGAGDDASLTFDGTDAVLDYDAQNSGTSSLKIQQNGTDALSVNSSQNIDLQGNQVLNPESIDGLKRRSSDITPANGEAAIWVSDGTASGTDGDLMYAETTAGGTTSTYTIDKTSV